jgi:AraC-like DNA-binding protein
VLENPEAPDGPVRDKILPDGCMELIFHYGDLFRQYREENVETQPRSFVYGQITQFIEIGPTGKTGVIAVRFYPNGAEPFLQIPMNELTNRAISIFDLFGRQGLELEERIVTAAGNGQRILILQNFLIDRLRTYNRCDFVIADSIKRMLQLQGKVNVESLSRRFNISARHLERKFVSTVGLNPKLLSRIIRFQNIFKLLQNGQIDSLTALAHESGYYDQAHFIRDFKHFSGINPKMFLNQEHRFSDHFIDKG